MKENLQKKANENEEEEQNARVVKKCTINYTKYIIPLKTMREYLHINSKRTILIKMKRKIRLILGRAFCLDMPGFIVYATVTCVCSAHAAMTTGSGCVV